MLTITEDNEKEFAYHEQSTDPIKVNVYFADPYSTLQHGSNEITMGYYSNIGLRQQTLKKYRKRKCH